MGLQGVPLAFPTLIIGLQLQRPLGLIAAPVGGTLHRSSEGKMVLLSLLSFGGAVPSFAAPAAAQFFAV
jgi:hypothetical protein